MGVNAVNSTVCMLFQYRGTSRAFIYKTLKHVSEQRVLTLLGMACLCSCLSCAACS